jgi:hypothetical protein
MAKNAWHLNEGARRPLKRRPRHPPMMTAFCEQASLFGSIPLYYTKCAAGDSQRLTLAHVGSRNKAGQPIYQVEPQLYSQAGRLAVEQVHSVP